MCYCFWNLGGLRHLNSGIHANMAGISPSNPSLQLQDLEGCFLLEFKLEKYFKLYKLEFLVYNKYIEIYKINFKFGFLEIIKNILTYRNSRLGTSTLSISLERKRNILPLFVGFFWWGGSLFLFLLDLETFNDGICSLTISHMYMYVLFTPPFSLLVPPPLLFPPYMCLFYTCAFLLLCDTLIFTRNIPMEPDEYTI